MPVIVPTITTNNIATFTQNLATFQSFAKRIQIDVSDGTLAPTQLVPLANMQLPDGVDIDIHLMSARPSDHLGSILSLKPSLCILHAEVDDNLANIFSHLRQAGIRTGLALLKPTFPRRAQELIAMVDHVMIFAGTLGQQGGQIDLLQIEKVPLIRELKSDLEVGWDGGINLSNIRALAHANIDVLNVGSAITQASDPGAMYQSLITESEKKGVLI